MRVVETIPINTAAAPVVSNQNISNQPQQTHSKNSLQTLSTVQQSQQDTHSTLTTFSTADPPSKCFDKSTQKILNKMLALFLENIPLAVPTHPGAVTIIQQPNAQLQQMQPQTQQTQQQQHQVQLQQVHDQQPQAQKQQIQPQTIVKCTPAPGIHHGTSKQSQEIHVSAQIPLSTKHPQQSVQENEQFAIAWLRATFEPTNTVTSRIEQQDLYKMYLTASSKVGRQGVVSPMQFPRCVRSVFSGPVGPNSIKIKQNNIEMNAMYYEGIRIRAKPMAIVHKGTILVKHILLNKLNHYNTKHYFQQGTVQTNEVIIKKPEHIAKQNINQATGNSSILVAQLSGKGVKKTYNPYMFHLTHCL